MNYSIKIIVDPNTILVGGDISSISVQLYQNNLPYKKSDITVKFSIDNDNIATLSSISNAFTDNNGIADILLVSKKNPGELKIIAEATIDGFKVTDTSIVKIVEWGIICGTIIDRNGNGVPNAKVTLNNLTKVSCINIVENVQIVKAPENPQLSSDGKLSPIGRYLFSRIPSGNYYVQAEKDEHSYFAIIHVTQGTVSNDIVIPDYIYFEPVFKRKKL